MIEYEDFSRRLIEADATAQDVHKRAREDFGFVAVRQWPFEDTRRLEERGQPALSFDQIGPVIRSVSGAEIVNRFEPRFMPRSASLQDVDPVISEATGEVYRMVRQQGDTEHHESRAFRDAVTTGLGFSEMYLDYEDHPEGRLLTRWVPIYEMAWDPGARHVNLSDAQWFIRAIWMTEDDFLFRFPDHEDVMHMGKTHDTALGAGFAGSPSVKGGDYDVKFHEGETGWWDARANRILVYDYQFNERKYQWRVSLPGNFPQIPVAADVVLTPGRVHWLEDDQIDDFEAAAASVGIPSNSIPQLSVRVPRRVWRRSYLTAGEVLEDEPTGLPGSSILPMTGFEDQSEEGEVTWFGLVRALKDPQLLTNKVISNMVYRVSASPSAVLAERGVFENEESVEDDLADPSKVVWMNAGGAKRVIPKFPQGSMPAGLDSLLQLSIASVPQISGVSQYTIGSVGDLRRTSARAVQSVQAGSQVVMSVLMDSLRLYRKGHARLSMGFVREFYPPDLIERIISPEHRAVTVGEQQVPTAALIKSSEVWEYDVVVDEAPTSPNAQAELRNSFFETQFLQQYLSSGRPMPTTLFDYIDLPPAVAAEMKQNELRFQQAQAAAMAAAQQSPDEGSEV